MKEIIERKYTEKEMQFISEYGKDNFFVWETLSEKEKSVFYKIKELVLSFSDLYYNHYEDLRLYAIYYHNVPLYNSANDLCTIIYFSSRIEQIIDFSSFLRKAAIKGDAKAKVTLMYAENEVLFPKFCNKHIGIDFQANYRPITIDTSLKRYVVEGERETKKTVISVNDLTQEQCKVLIKYQGGRTGEYKALYDKYLYANRYMPSLLVVGDQYEYALNGFIRFCQKPDDFVVDYLATKMNLKNESIKNKLLSYAELYNTKITKEKDEILKLQKELTYTNWEESTEYRIAEFDRGQEFRYNTVRGFFDTSNNNLCINSNWLERLKEEERRKQEIEKYRKEKEAMEQKYEERRRLYEKTEHARIAKVQQLINQKKSDISNASDAIQYSVQSSEIFRTLISNVNEINKLYNVKREIQYNKRWLEETKLMQEDLMHTTIGVPSNHRMRLPMLFGWYKSKRPPFDWKYYTKEVTLMSVFCNLYKDIEEEKRRIEIEKRQKQLEEERLKKEREEQQRRYKYQFNQRNRFWRDDNIRFVESSHEYNVNGRRLESVTQIIENVFPKFDVDLHATNVAMKKGVSVESIKEAWEQKAAESRMLGTQLHKNIEAYFLGNTCQDSKEFRYFKELVSRISFNPYRTEWTVYDEDSGIAGTIDYVDSSSDGFTLYDWKRSDKVIVNGFPAKLNQYGEKGNYPISHIDNSTYYHYALQLSFYRYILEKNYSVYISSMRLGIFHPSYPKPYLLEMPYLKDEVCSIVELRKEILF